MSKVLRSMPAVSIDFTVDCYSAAFGQLSVGVATACGCTEGCRIPFANPVHSE